MVDAMITLMTKRVEIILVIVLGLLGAASVSSAPAQTNLIPLVAGGPHQGAFQSPYLTINYSYTLNQGQLSASGTLKFDDSLTMSYPGLRHFYMELVLADNQGRTVERSKVTLNSGFTWGDNDAEAASSFSAQVTVPPNTASMTFYYNGATQGSMGSGSGTSFWNNPIPSVN